jgi:hypothetical protein
MSKLEARYRKFATVEFTVPLQQTIMRRANLSEMTRHLAEGIPNRLSCPLTRGEPICAPSALQICGWWHVSAPGPLADMIGLRITMTIEDL